MGADHLEFVQISNALRLKTKLTANMIKSRYKYLANKNWSLHEERSNII